MSNFSLKANKVFAVYLILLSLFGFGVFTTLILDSDFGRVESEKVWIETGNNVIAGLIYKPKTSEGNNSAPGLVLAHGIGGSKEMMSSIGLELARRGFVALCIDLLGHGDSEGKVSEGLLDPSFGVNAAISYLASQSFVNSSLLGLIGHSLGAGAIRATLTKEKQIDVVIMIGGGVGKMFQDAKYSPLNASYPRNLLLIVGKYDVLFDLSDLLRDDLPNIFGSQKVVPNVLYGNFSFGTARKIIVPYTTHLFEPYDGVVVQEAVDWVQNSFGSFSTPTMISSSDLIYHYREMSIALVFGILIGLSILTILPFERERLSVKINKFGFGLNREDALNSHIAWGAINIALFFPLFLAGTVIGFPPLIFGSSMAWWMLCSGLFGLFFLAKFSKFFGKNAVIGQKVAKLDKYSFTLAVMMFLAIFLVVSILAWGLNFSFRLISPIFREISSLRRALVIVAFVPFCFPHFLAEGMYLHESNRLADEEYARYASFEELLIAVLAKTWPFIILLLLNYALKITFNLQLFPSIMGFLIEFFWLIIPILAVAVCFSWAFYKRTGNIIYGAFFNSLMVAWIAGGVFPF